MERNELIKDILTYLEKLKVMAQSAHRNNAYIKGVRDSMKMVQAFMEATEIKEAVENDEGTEDSDAASETGEDSVEA